MRRVRAHLVFLDFERLEFVTAGGLHEDFDFLLGFLERGLARARELDALFKFLHGFFKRQITGLKLFDQCFEISEGFFKINGFFGVHYLLS